jgi:hypothetical protein
MDKDQPTEKLTAPNEEIKSLKSSNRSNASAFAMWGSERNKKICTDRAAMPQPKILNRPAKRKMVDDKKTAPPARAVKNRRKKLKLLPLTPKLFNPPTQEQPEPKSPPTPIITQLEEGGISCS